MKKKVFVPLCILLIAIISGAIWYFIGTKKYDSWQSTNAIVANIDYYSKARGIGGGSSHRYYYNYAVNGVNYSGTDMFSGRTASYTIGETIEVWVDPANPSKSIISKNVDLNFIAPIFLAIPLMLGAYSVFSKIDKKSKLLNDL